MLDPAQAEALVQMCYFVLRPIPPQSTICLQKRYQRVGPCQMYSQTKFEAKRTTVACCKNRGSFVTFVLMNPNPIGAHFRMLNNKHIPTDTVKTRDGGEKALEISA